MNLIEKTARTERVYDSNESFLSLIFLLVQVGTVLFLIFDKQYLPFVITNPILFLVIGTIFYRKKVVYVASNVLMGSYTVVVGRPAQFLGISFFLIGLLSLFLFNIPYFHDQPQTAHLWFGQFIVSIILTLGVAIKYGEMLFPPPSISSR